MQPVDATQQTYDFSSMYTTLDLKELRKKMTSFVDRVFDRQVGKGVKKKKERGPFDRMQDYNSKQEQSTLLPPGKTRWGAVGKAQNKRRRGWGFDLFSQTKQ